ncbi:GNAT family N-acetyltransferase [Levilactobacillus humaensis]|uniref:GNAT family N-acetyltransferase n=1 Tax=Levilactobacillus humaensis TaxID=2950375 RepID=UPI0021C4ABE3|nr:GNAT family N-acetyltransferase [Levilactobacillus humaensis]
MTKPTFTIVATDQLAELRRLSIDTFTDAFGAQNTAADLQAYLTKAFSPSQLASELADVNSQFYFIQVANAVRGYLKLVSHTDYLEIQRLYLTSAVQHQGYGAAAIVFAARRAQLADKSELRLGVWEHNLAAIAFYRSQGFQQTSSHPFQLGSATQTDLIMTKKI